MESSLTTKRREVMERVWKEKKFSSTKEFADTIKEYTVFTGLAFDSIYTYATIYLREIGESFGIGGGCHGRLSAETLETRKTAIDAVVKELKDSGENSLTTWDIAKRLKNDPSFVACGSMQTVVTWVKNYLNPKKELVHRVQKAKRNQAISENKSELKDNADIFELAKVSDDFSRGHEYAKSSFEALREETIRLRLRVVEYGEHVCPDVSAVHAMLGEKEMKLQSEKTRCGNLEAQLASANEKIAGLMSQTRDPDEGLKYELREQKEQVQALQEKIIWWELRCDALAQKPLKIDPLRHLVLGGEVKR